MKLTKIRLSILIILLTSFVFSCGPLGTVSGDRSITYEEDFDTMVETVEQAIRGRTLEINFAEKSDDGNRYQVLFHDNEYLNNNNDSQRTNEGEVIVERLEEDKTKVIINNPEYHYTIPSHQQKKYDQELKEKIEEILDS